MTGKAFGEENPTLGESAVSWQTWSDGAAGIPDVQGDSDWGKLQLSYTGEEGRSAVYDLGSAKTRTFTLTENRYGTGSGNAQLQYRTDTSAFVQDDVLPAWSNYAFPFSVNCQYIQVRETTELLAPAFFVAPAGDGGDDGNPGTEAQPWETIQHAVDTAVAGDTIYIREGTYNEQVVLGNSGTSGNIIIVRNYPGETVTIDGTDIVLVYSGLVDFSYKNYIYFIGIRVINAENYSGIRIANCDHIRISHVYTYNTYYAGIGSWSNSTNITIDNNEVELACVSRSEECIQTSTTSKAEIYNNYVHDAYDLEIPGSGGQGINIKEGSHDVRVHDNIVCRTAYAYGVDAWDRHTYNIYFYNNVAYDSDYGFLAESEEGGLCENVWFYNNIVYDVYPNHSGLCLPLWGGSPGNVQNIYFINNTVFGNAYGFRQYTTNASNIIIRNNIFSNNTNNPQITIIGGEEGHFTIDHNLFDTPNTTVGTDAVQGDPLFVSEITPDFHIGDGSPAIAAGSSTDAPTHDYDNVSRGVSIDIGSFEHV